MVKQILYECSIDVRARCVFWRESFDAARDKQLRLPDEEALEQRDWGSLDY
ncbi:MAG: hypothetical protein AABZ66_02880 [Candidatus Binatota bacterium]